MWGWLAIFVGLFGGLIAIAPIQARVKRVIKLSEAHINIIRVSFVIMTTVTGALGLDNRLKNESWLKNRLGTVEKVNEEQKWKRASQFRITGSLYSMCDGGDYLCGNLMKNAYEFKGGVAQPNCSEENYKK